MKNKIDWVWVDCFNSFPLNKKQYTILKKYFKLCYVSPELQQQPEKISTYKKIIITQKLIPDMICTKIYNINKWIN